MLAALVLGYGLFRRSMAARQRMNLAKRANEICAISLKDLAAMPGGERAGLLAEARQLRLAIENESQAYQSEADALGSWIAGQADLQRAIDRRRREVESMEASINYVFPRDGAEQLPPEVVEALQKAAARAKNAQDDLVVEIRGTQVDVTEAFRDRIRMLAGKADQVTAELKRRDTEYTHLVETVDRLLSSGRIEEAKKEPLEPWFSRVAADPAKKKKLEDLHEKLANLDQRPQREGVLKERVAGVVKALGSASVAETRVALEQSLAVLEDAGRFDSKLLEPEIKKLDEARAAAAERLKSVDREARNEEKRQLLTQAVAERMQGLFPPDTGDDQKKRIREEVVKSLAELKVLAPPYEEVLSQALNRLAPDPNTPPPKPKETTQYSTPDWKALDAHRGNLKAVAGRFRDWGEKRKKDPSYTNYINKARQIDDHLDALERVINQNLAEAERLQAAAQADQKGT